MANRKTLVTAISFFTVLLVSVISDAASVCTPTHDRFQCPNGGHCIALSSVCDFKVDCSDGGDEMNCTRTACDEEKPFQCKNGKCIFDKWKCDGEDDCFDNTDEEESLCLGRVCSKNEFHCFKSNTCIDQSYKCDGDVDCNDGEDEDNCPTPICQAHQTLCADKTECVDKEYLCDGEEDCEDGSDENDCKGVVCEDDQFRCANGTQCISTSERCDGLTDCIDESDEKDCPSDHPNRCRVGFFACRSGVCLPEMFKCNGDDNCPDGSDEVGCDFIKHSCPRGEKLCENRRQCINESLWCDGVRDCIDKSDEDDCPSTRPNKSCHLDTHFRCKSGRCIQARQVCDYIPHCQDGDDEPALCDVDECRKANGNCSHECIDLKIGRKCACLSGYRLADDELTCQDIDECTSLDNICEGICQNRPGSYRCLSEGVRSKVNFILGDSDTIVNLTLQHRKFLRRRLALTANHLLNELSVSSVAVDVKNKFVYWTDQKAEAILRVNVLDLTRKETFLSGAAIEDPISLAYDWVHGLLFWGDVTFASVSVVSVDKPNQPKTLMKYRDSEVLSVAVHPKYGYLFVGSEGVSGSGKIERCGMDGQDCMTLINFVTPNDIAVDTENDLLYWLEHDSKRIGFSYLDGHDQRIISVHQHNPTSLAVIGNRVYFADIDVKHIISVNRLGKDVRRVKHAFGSQPDLAVYEEDLQEEGQNQCGENACSGLCLPSSSATAYKGYSCVCPDGFFISPTNSCETIPTTSPKTTTPKATAKPVTMTTSSTSTNQTSAVRSPPLTTSSSSTVVIIGVIALAVLLVAILCLVIRYKRQRFARMSMNFNNPIYRKMNERPPSGSFDPGVTEGSPSTSSGDVSNHSTDGTAALVMNEEAPARSRPPNFSNMKFDSNGIYAEIPDNDISGNIGNG